MLVFFPSFLRIKMQTCLHHFFPVCTQNQLVNQSPSVDNFGTNFMPKPHEQTSQKRTSNLQNCTEALHIHISQQIFESLSHSSQKQGERAAWH